MADSEGRPPSIPPLDGIEAAHQQEMILWLRGGDPDGKVDGARWERWKEETKLEWAIQLRLLARRAHGRDAEALIKLGASLLGAPKAKE